MFLGVLTFNVIFLFLYFCLVLFRTLSFLDWSLILYYFDWLAFRVFFKLTDHFVKFVICLVPLFLSFLNTLSFFYISSSVIWYVSVILFSVFSHGVHWINFGEVSSFWRDFIGSFSRMSYLEGWSSIRIEALLLVRRSH